MPTPKQIKRLSYLKAVRLEKIIDDIEKRIRSSSSDLTKSMLQMFLQKLKTEEGRIVSRLNQQTITLFNQAYKRYQERSQKKLQKSILADIQLIIDDNDSFYKETTKRTASQKQSIKKIVNQRLGLDETGKVVKKGFMSSLFEDAGLKSDLQKHIFRELFRNTGPKH